MTIHHVRPSFARTYSAIARVLADRSSCSRLQVGCVIVSGDHQEILAGAYNGSASGAPNACASLEPGSCGHVHAEVNAAVRCRAPRGEAKVVYCTHMPCAACARVLVNLGGVVRVLYEEPYRLTEGVEILEAACARVDRLIWSAGEPIPSP